MVIKNWIILPPKGCELHVHGVKIQNVALSNVLQTGVWDEAISRGTVQRQLFWESGLGMEKVLQNSSGEFWRGYIMLSNSRALVPQWYFHHGHIYQIYLHFLIFSSWAHTSNLSSLSDTIMLFHYFTVGEGVEYLCPYFRINWNSSSVSIPEAPVTAILSRNLSSFGLHLYVFTFSLLSAETHKCFSFAQALMSWSWLPGELPLVWEAVNVEGHPRDAVAAKTIGCSHLNSSWFLWGKALNMEHRCYRVLTLLWPFCKV